MANSDDRYEMLRDRELSKLSWGSSWVVWVCPLCASFLFFPFNLSVNKTALFGS